MKVAQCATCKEELEEGWDSFLWNEKLGYYLCDDCAMQILFEEEE